MVPAFNRKISVLLSPASQTAAATRTAVLDTLGADYAEININFAAEVNTSAVGPTIALTESDTTDASNYATWSSSCTRAAEDPGSGKLVTFKIDTRSRKRYIKLTQTAATHTTNDIITSSADAILDRLEAVAPGTAALTGSTNNVVVVL